MEDGVMEKAAKPEHSTILAYFEEPLGFCPQNKIDVRGLLGLQTKQLHYIRQHLKLIKRKRKQTLNNPSTLLVLVGYKLTYLLLQVAYNASISPEKMVKCFEEMW